MQPTITAAINATVRHTTHRVRRLNIRSAASEPAPQGSQREIDRSGEQESRNDQRRDPDDGRRTYRALEQPGHGASGDG